jgi:hypothetical protein
VEKADFHDAPQALIPWRHPSPTDSPYNIPGRSTMPAKPLPPVLYKYYSAARIEAIENGLMRFTPPNTFNDTFDSDYLISKASSPRGSLDRARNRTNYGIFCLTEDPTNHLMWVHYAGGHTGFVVGFKSADPIFKERFAILDAVDYTDGPMPVVPDPTDPPISVFLQKSTVWDYEEEWRCVRKFGTDEQRDVYFFPDAIHEIIIGSKMAAHDISRLLGYAHYSNASGNPVEVKDSIPVRKERKFECTPTKRVFCTDCGGKGHT